MYKAEALTLTKNQEVIVKSGEFAGNQGWMLQDGMDHGSGRKLQLKVLEDDGTYSIAAIDYKYLEVVSINVIDLKMLSCDLTGREIKCGDMVALAALQYGGSSLEIGRVLEIPKSGKITVETILVDGKKFAKRRQVDPMKLIIIPISCEDLTSTILCDFDRKLKYQASQPLMAAE